MDHNNETLVNDAATDAQNDQIENQAKATKSYSQEEVDNMMARMRGSLERKLLKPYEDLGDPTELRNLREAEEKRNQEEALKRGEFEKTLQELAAKKDAEIQKRDSLIKEYKVNSPLLDAAAKHKSINPAQVRQLLSQSVRLNETGDEVEVLDDSGNVRYDDSGSLLKVDDLVKEFLDTNPHFKVAGASATNSKTNVSSGTPSKFDLNDLDLTNPEHRKLYKEAKAKGTLPY
jgi:hypothetical protein